MGFRTKFCVIAGPIVLIAGIAQAMEPEPSLNYNDTDSDIVAPVPNADPLIVRSVNGNSVEFYNNSKDDIYYSDVKLQYFAGGGLPNEYTPYGRIWNLEAGESRSFDFEIDFEHAAKADRFSLYESYTVVIDDNEYGNALRDIMDKSEVRPLDLTKAECYALQGYAPATPCDGYKIPSLSHDDLFGTDSGFESTINDDELQAAIEFIEDGTMEYAQEFAGK